MSEQTVTFNLELNVERSFSGMRRLELIMFRVFGLWGRICRILGLPSDSPINVVAAKAQQITMIARQIHTAATLIEAASGPLGWAMAILGVAAAGVTVAEFVTTPSQDAVLTLGE